MPHVPDGYGRFVTAVHVLLVRDGELLMLRRGPGSAFAPGLLSLPAGHLEHGERVMAAAVRELREEVGIGLTEAMLEIVHVMQHHTPCSDVRFSYFLRATDWPDHQQEPFNAEPHKHSELLWVPLGNALPSDTVEYVWEALGAIRDGHRFSEHMQDDNASVAHDPHRPGVLRPLREARG